MMISGSALTHHSMMPRNVASIAMPMMPVIRVIIIAILSLTPAVSPALVLPAARPRPPGRAL